MTAPGTDVTEATTTELVVPAEFAEFVPDDLPHSTEAIEVWVQRAREQAEALEIETEEDAQKAVDLTKEFKREIDRFEQERLDLTKPRKDAAEFIKAQFDKAKAPFEEHNAVVVKEIDNWRAAKKREAEERQRKAEEERQRVEAEARRKREAAEKAEREAEQMRREEKNTEDAKAAEELAAEARRDAERAQVTEQAIQSLPPDAPVSAPTLSGLSDRTKREAFVIDRSLLPDTLPDGTPLVVVDMVALRRWMNQQWSATGNPPSLPGAEFKRVPDGSSVRA
jgi:hypothetical protein